MGKGDKKSKRGKIFAGSFGVRRRKRKDKPTKVSIMVAEEKPIKQRKSKKETS
jgi:ribosomal small subunit protein bTHX